MSDVRAAAMAFRQAILECPDTGLISLREFPNGSCGDASPLLGQFLDDQGLGKWEYVSGERKGDRHSHAWIEQRGLIVDITADQFPDIEEAVIVTRDRSWHDQFLYFPNPRHLAGVEIYDPRTRQMLRTSYERIMVVYGRK